MLCEIGSEALLQQMLQCCQWLTDVHVLNDEVLKLAASLQTNKKKLKCII